MAILTLMYHKTPPTQTNDGWSVSLPSFRQQIDILRNQGFEFIRLSDVTNEHYYSRRTYICITFDDGHKSNLEAFALLRERRIVPTAFIVRQWAQPNSEFMSAADLSSIGDWCEFGGHGMTHCDLTKLSQRELRDELTVSKTFLEDACGKTVTTMSVPGGRINARVVQAALQCGYRLIGNSVPLVNHRPRKTMNRIAIRSHDSPQKIALLANAGVLYWMRQRMRTSAQRMALHILGERRYKTFRGIISG